MSAASLFTDIRKAVLLRMSHRKAASHASMAALRRSPSNPRILSTRKFRGAPVFRRVRDEGVAPLNEPTNLNLPQMNRRLEAPALVRVGENDQGEIRPG